MYVARFGAIGSEKKADSEVGELSGHGQYLSTQ